MIHINANPHYLAHKFSYPKPNTQDPLAKTAVGNTAVGIPICPLGVRRSFLEAFIEAFMNKHLLLKNLKRITTVGTAQLECFSTEQSQLSSGLKYEEAFYNFSYSSHN